MCAGEREGCGPSFRGKKKRSKLKKEKQKTGKEKGKHIQTGKTKPEGTFQLCPALVPVSGGVVKNTKHWHQDIACTARTSNVTSYGFLSLSLSLSLSLNEKYAKTQTGRRKERKETSGLLTVTTDWCKYCSPLSAVHHSSLIALFS